MHADACMLLGVCVFPVAVKCPEGFDLGVLGGREYGNERGGKENHDSTHILDGFIASLYSFVHMNVL